MPDPEQLRRWRLILGKDAQAPLDGVGGCNLSGSDAEMDRVCGLCARLKREREERRARERNNEK